MGKPLEGDSPKSNYSISLSDEANRKALEYSELQGMSKSMYIQTLILAETATNQFIDFQNRIKQIDESIKMDTSQTECQIKMLESQIGMLREQLKQRNDQRESQKAELLNMTNIIKAKNDPNSVITTGYDEYKDKEKAKADAVENQSRKKSYALFNGYVSGEKNFFDTLCAVINKYHGKNTHFLPSEFEDIPSWKKLEEKARGIKWSNLSFDDITSTKTILTNENIPKEKAAPTLAVIDKWLNPTTEETQ